jgi:hypothetical protein
MKGNIGQLGAQEEITKVWNQLTGEEKTVAERVAEEEAIMARDHLSTVRIKQQEMDDLYNQAGFPTQELVVEDVDRHEFGERARPVAVPQTPEQEQFAMPDLYQEI